MTRVIVTLADELWLNPSPIAGHPPLLSKAWAVRRDTGESAPGIADPPPLLVMRVGRTIALDIECQGCIALITGVHDGTIVHTNHSPYGPGPRRDA